MGLDVKQVQYAFPTSSLACTLGCSKDGAYCVLIGPEGGRSDIYGPFDTIQDAESAAESVDTPWDWMYKEYSLNGSQFKR
ncbi:hypothetical protein LCGC14_1311390 [marine sediment metagenome]|uniref:Uncharacterized protein n=1 Tax=marine sediment metagenome TaxID=412755 RepID=A0A0F9NPM3_9ZZZZ